MRKHFDFYGYNAPTWGGYYHDDQTYFLGEDFRSVKRYKEYKTKCYCYQSSYNYKRKEKVLCGNKEPFTVKRFVVIQMK